MIKFASWSVGVVVWLITGDALHQMGYDPRLFLFGSGGLLSAYLISKVARRVWPRRRAKVTELRGADWITEYPPLRLQLNKD